MAEAFATTLSLGGDIDRVGEIGKLPHPIFPSKTMPKVKGLVIDVPPNTGTFSKTVTANVDVEFVAVSLACTGYLYPDFWEYSVGYDKVMETIYTKEVPQTIYSGTQMTLVLPIPAGTPMRLDFVNKSGTSKQALFDLKLLVSPSDYNSLVLTEN